MLILLTKFKGTIAKFSKTIILNSTKYLTMTNINTAQTDPTHTCLITIMYCLQPTPWNPHQGRHASTQATQQMPVLTQIQM